MIQLAIKDLKLFLKDRRSMLVTFAIPIALITLFAFAFGGAGKSSSKAKISLLVSDLDNTSASQGAIARLDTLKSIQLKALPLAEAQKAIENGDESSVLVVHQGFADSLKKGGSLPLELQYDESKEIEVGMLQQSLIPTIAMLPFNMGNSREMMGNRLAKMAGSSNTQAKEDIQAKSDNLFDAISKGVASGNGNKTKNNPASNFFGSDIKMTKLVKATNDNQLGLVQAVAGTAVMMLLFSVVGIGMGLLDEKQEGTLKRLLYTPMNPLNILFGKMISANVISILQLVIMFIYASLVFGLDIASHLPGLLLTIIATAFACSAFGVLLASFAKSRQQVQGLSTLIILVMSALGGSMIPLFLMPALMQKVAVISVNYWSIQGFYDVFWRNLPVLNATFLSRILVLLLIGLALNSWAVVMFRKNILKLT
ncbi:MAG: ABC transporter permease [Bacteroidetes bacterium]|nr:ABC transporter permease [Bacteroidota bacterium]MBS1539316.1 ABC transporter permease [Bacteroidota bacterium]